MRKYQGLAGFERVQLASGMATAHTDPDPEPLFEPLARAVREELPALALGAVFGGAIVAALLVA